MMYLAIYLCCLVNAILFSRVYSGCSSKKTVATINKNLSFDSKKESSFILDINSNNHSDNLNQIEKLLKKKITSKVFNKKSSKYNVLFDSNKLIFSLRYWFLFQNKFHFDRRDIDDEEEGVYSIALETSNMKTSKRPGKTSLIIITFEMEPPSSNEDNDNNDNVNRLDQIVSQLSQKEDDDDNDDSDGESCCLINSNTNEVGTVQQPYQLKVNIIGTANGISKKDFDCIITTLQSLLYTELHQELQLYQARIKQGKSLSEESKERLVYERKRTIDKVIHPEKYAKPKGRAGKNGESSGRYRPSADAQARRTVKKGG